MQQPGFLVSISKAVRAPRTQRAHLKKKKFFYLREEREQEHEQVDGRRGEKEREEAEGEADFPLGKEVKLGLPGQDPEVTT